MNNNWLNGMPTGGLSDFQRQQLAQAQAQNQAGLGLGGIPNFNPAMMGGVNMNGLTPAQRQQMALQQHAARMNAGLGAGVGNVNMGANPNTPQGNPGLEGRVQMLEQEALMLTRAVKDIISGKKDIKLTPTMSAGDVSGERFTMASAGVKSGSASIHKAFQPSKSGEVTDETEDDYSQGSRFLENGFGSFKHKLETKVTETPNKSQGDKIMPTSVKLDSELLIGKIYRIEGRYITSDSLLQMHEIHEGLNDPSIGGFISTIVETSDIATVPYGFINSGLWTENPERFSTVLSGFLEKAENESDRIYFQVVDDIITDRVNDYLDSSYGGTLDSYAADMKQATHAICGAFNIVQSTFEKEIGDIVSDTICSAYSGALADVEAEAAEQGVAKETVPMDIHSSGIVIYINHSSRDIGLDVVKSSILREVDPNSTSVALMEAYKTAYEYTKDVLNKPKYVTCYITTRDRKVFKLVRNKDGKSFIARHFTRS